MAGLVTSDSLPRWPQTCLLQGSYALPLITLDLPWLPETVLSLSVDMPDRLSRMCLSIQVIMGTDSLGSLWAVLLLPLVFGVPTEEPTVQESLAPHLTKGCQRCCDPEEPLFSADAVHAPVSPSFRYVLPEVRPYINMTILKGELSHWAGRGPNWSGIGREAATEESRTGLA